MRANLTTARKFYFILLASLWGMLGLFYLNVSGGSFLYFCIGLLADSGLLVFLLGFLRGRWKYIALVVPFLVAVLVWANVVYFRNFSDLIPGPLYLHNQLGDPLVKASIGASLRWTDLALALLAVLPCLYVWRVGDKRFAASNLRPGRWLYVGAGVALLWICPYVYMFCRNAARFEDIDPDYNLKTIFPDYFISWREVYQRHHFTGYVIKVLANLNKPQIALNEEDRAYIRDYLTERALSDGPLPAEAYGPERPNLIIVIVESLTYDVLETPEGAVAAPTLRALMDDDEVVTKKVMSLAGAGRSSDAQFVYNTGLLPLRDQPLVAFYAANDYPSLAKALSLNSLEIIGEDRSLWRHGETSQSYGYETLISGVAPNTLNQDSLIFARTLREIGNLKPPFLLTVSTLSMHNPYGQPAVRPSPRVSALKIDDDRDREYLQRLSHFDSQLKAFLMQLKSTGVYDESTIVITGDHEVGVWEVSPLLHAAHVPLIIINSPLRQTRDIEVTQLDFFPSVLDMRDARYTYRGVPYRGLGKSIFLGAERDSAPHPPAEEDYRVSEMIIKSDF